MNLKETISMLRDTADCLESFKSGVICPDFSGTDLKAAAARLRLAFPGITFSIAAPRIMFYGHHDEPSMDPWSVYVHNGNTDRPVGSFEGKTLAEAVNAALASEAPPTADPVGDIQKALTPAPF